MLAMRRCSLIIVLCLFISAAFSQEKEELMLRRTAFYQDLVKGSGIDDLLDDSLSYGHSNGWIETKRELPVNLGGILVYHSIQEDSVSIVVSGEVAHVRFIGDFDVSLNGKRNTYRLRVLEVWVKRGKEWKIFARQAIKG